MLQLLLRLELLYKNVSVFMVVNAILSVMLFKEYVRISETTISKVIMWLSNVSFGVFIIHEHPVILDKFFTKMSFGGISTTIVHHICV